MIDIDLEEMYEKETGKELASTRTHEYTDWLELKLKSQVETFMPMEYIKIKQKHTGNIIVTSSVICIYFDNKMKEVVIEV